MADEEKKSFKEKVEEAKESSKIKREERILKMEEKNPMLKSQLKKKN